MRATLALLAALAATPALAVDLGRGHADPAVTAARAAIDAGDFNAALTLLSPYVADHPRDADALNLVGFASRKAGALEQAATFYAAALAVEPDHLGALEYQGELFLQQGDRAAAEANLARLTALCGACEEREDLAAALAGS